MEDFVHVLKQNAYENCIPIQGTFELTARCNFDCNMCYVHLGEDEIPNHGRELTNEEWLDIARQAKDAGMLYLTLTGGEVFVRPRFRELYEELAKMGFLIQIFSNGYCVDENVMEWLEQMPPYMLRFTLYGASDETYEKVCGIKNGFSKVSHAIDLVKKTNIPFYMVSTLVKENQHDVDDMRKFAKDKNVIFQLATSIVKSNRGVKRDIEAHRIFLESIVIEKTEKAPKIENLLSVCGKYRVGFWITWNGNIQLCGFMNDPAISLLKYSFKKSWGKLLLELNKIKMPNECSDCQYSAFCSRCPGVLAAECGGCNQVTESFCENAKRIFHAYYRGKGEIK